MDAASNRKSPWRNAASKRSMSPCVASTTPSARGKAGHPLLRLRRHREGIEDEKRDALGASNNEVAGVAGVKVNGAAGEMAGLGWEDMGCFRAPNRGVFAQKQPKPPIMKTPKTLRFSLVFGGKKKWRT